MISYVKGLLAAIESDVIIVEAGALGYAIHVPLSLLDQLPGIGREVLIYTYFQVREDAMTLYGFLNRQDRDMFRQLIGVNGIGPKAALGILSAMTPDDLRMAIVTGDAKAIAKAPGVGPKTAGRLILDLKDKVSVEDVLDHLGGTAQTGDAAMGAGLSEAAKEAVSALIALGYTSGEASKAVKQAAVGEDMTAEDVLKASLHYLYV